MFDAELYREKSEVDEWKKKDPILSLQNRLIELRLTTEEDIQQLVLKVEQEIQKAVEFAEAGTWEPVSSLTKFVYSGK